METLKIALTRAMMTFVDEQTEATGCPSASEYIRQLIRREQDRLRVHPMLIDGAATLSEKSAE